MKLGSNLGYSFYFVTLDNLFTSSFLSINVSVNIQVNEIVILC